jgi:hypothetical protein
MELGVCDGISASLCVCDGISASLYWKKVKRVCREKEVRKTWKKFGQRDQYLISAYFIGWLPFFFF